MDTNNLFLAEYAYYGDDYKEHNKVKLVIAENTEDAYNKARTWFDDNMNNWYTLDEIIISKPIT